MRFLQCSKATRLISFCSKERSNTSLPIIAAHEEIMKGDFAKGEIKVWKVNEETVAKNALELESDINKWKCSEHAPCYKVADIFVPMFGVIIGDLTIHITEDMVFYIYSDFNGVHNYGRFLDESDKRLKKCLESGLIRHQSHRGAIEGLERVGDD